MNTNFGTYVRETRERLRTEKGSAYSLRQVAARVGVSATYLSNVELGEGSLPAEPLICKLADELQMDKNVLLAMAGKVSTELQDIILKRPTLFAQILREMQDLPDHAILKLVREVRTGEW